MLLPSTKNLYQIEIEKMLNLNPPQYLNPVKSNKKIVMKIGLDCFAAH